MSEVFETELKIPVQEGCADLLGYFEDHIQSHLPAGLLPTRFVVNRTEASHYSCSVGCLRSEWPFPPVPSIFSFRRRHHANSSHFNVALIIPTGVGAVIGGHAGDATPVARLFGSIAHRLVTHPNVVNASDINEMPPNTCYVEGSVLTQLLMGTVGLQEVRSNRVLVIIEGHPERQFVDNTVNAINAARACYGLDCTRVVVLRPSFRMRAFTSASGRAIGHVSDLDHLFAALEHYRGQYDAVALASVIQCPPDIHLAYFQSDGAMVNPWGGVEAMLTHTVSHLYGLPTAHGPVAESEEHEDLGDIGPVDPRMAAEAISLTYMQCVFKGLQRSPRVVTEPDDMAAGHTMTAEDISLLVTPDGCLGLPLLAALKQGIPVIAVRGNTNVMQNSLESLPWAEGQFFKVNTYLEAAGLALAIREGISVPSLGRPLPKVETDVFVHDRERQECQCLNYYGKEALRLNEYREEDFDYTVEYADNPEFL